MTERLDTAAALVRAVDRLGAIEPAFGRLRDGGIVPALRKREGGFAGLASIVVGQQVSVQSAAAIFGRLRTAYPDLIPDAIAADDNAPMRAAGLSRAKIATLRAVAGACLSGRLRFDDLADLAPDAAVAALTAIPGIGPWTASVYLLFCLGHPGVFPAGDLALQEAARIVFDLPGRPGIRAMQLLAQSWRPEGGAAAYMLWAFYRARTGRDVAAITDAAAAGSVSSAQRNRDATPP